MKLIKNLHFFCFFLLLSCAEKKSNNHNNKVLAQNLVIEHSVSDLNDSIFFSQITDIEIDSNLIFLTDFVQNRILVIDFNQQLIDYFGTEGRGHQILVEV